MKQLTKKDKRRKRSEVTKEIDKKEEDKIKLKTEN